MRVEIAWSGTKACREVQVCWGCIHEHEELDTRIGKASAIMRALHYSVVMKRELSKKTKLSIFKTVFAPILTFGYESWVMIKRVRSHLQAPEMRFLRRN